jgi:hypothetical protein
MKASRHLKHQATPRPGIGDEGYHVTNFILDVGKPSRRATEMDAKGPVSKEWEHRACHKRWRGRLFLKSNSHILRCIVYQIRYESL